VGRHWVTPASRRRFHKPRREFTAKARRHPGIYEGGGTYDEGLRRGMRNVSEKGISPPPVPPAAGRL